MKNSRAVFSEVQKKAGAFPFNVRALEDEKRARLGLQEAVQHGLIKPYEVVYVDRVPNSYALIDIAVRRYTPANTFVAAFHFTIALVPAGPLLLTHPPVWYKPGLVKAEKELEDDELKGLLSKSLRESKKNKKKAKEAEGNAADDA